jgi:hypothetical protein
MMIRTISLTTTPHDDLVGVYADERFCFSAEHVDDGSYLGGGIARVAVGLAAAAFVGLCAEHGVAVTVRLLDEG